MGTPPLVVRIATTRLFLCAIRFKSMAIAQKRGRPATFQASDRRKLAELVRLHGARGARERSGVSVGTLLRIAREYGIGLK
jgi:hypothetical protein